MRWDGRVNGNMEMLVLVVAAELLFVYIWLRLDATL